MAIRTFIDSAGCAWDVWEVHPSFVDRRRHADRRSEKRATLERRIANSESWLHARREAGAWLVLRSTIGRWRLAPVPSGWETMNDVALHELVVHAVRARDQRAVVSTPQGQSLEAR
jgi:hypothetical protein